MKQKVLFICVHNSARSQMAEAFLNEICGDDFEAHSAGLELGKLNPLVVEAMREIGIDISRKQAQSVSEAVESGDWAEAQRQAEVLVNALAAETALMKQISAAVRPN